MARIKIIAENQVTFREKTLPSLKCKLKCFHCHPRLNVHVVADLCQKTPKFFNFIKMNEWIFRQKKMLQILDLKAFSAFVKPTKGIQSGFVCVIIYVVLFQTKSLKSICKVVLGDLSIIIRIRKLLLYLQLNFDFVK